MKVSGVISAAQSIINRQGRGDKRAIRPIGRQRTEGSRILEKKGQVVQIADVRIIDDRVGIVEMESILEMVSIYDRHHGQ